MLVEREASQNEMRTGPISSCGHRASAAAEACLGPLAMPYFLLLVETGMAGGAVAGEKALPPGQGRGQSGHLCTLKLSSASPLVSCRIIRGNV